MSARHARGAFLPAVVRAATWRQFAVAEGLALTVALVRWLERQEASVAAPLSDRAFPGSLSMFVVVMSLGAVVMLGAMLCADEAVARGAPGRLTYCGSLVLSSVLAAVVTAHCRAWLGFPIAAVDLEWPRLLEKSIEFVIYGGLAQWIHFNRRACARMLDGVQRAERERALLERRLLESRLVRTEARVDPTLLFDALREIRRDFDSGAPGAEGKLDALIGKLRLSLSRAIEATGAGAP
jgi:hypothetical protein